jgi:hypothetical protein
MRLKHGAEQSGEMVYALWTWLRIGEKAFATKS